MNIHQQIEEWMATAVSNGLSSNEQQIFEKHLSECPECQKLYKEELVMSALIEKHLKEEKPDPRFEDRLVQQFRRKVPSRTPWLQRLLGWFGWIRQPKYLLPVTAMACVVLLVQVGNVLTRSERFDHIQAKGCFESEPQMFAEKPVSDMLTVSSASAPASPPVPTSGSMGGGCDVGASRELKRANSPALARVEPSRQEVVATTGSTDACQPTLQTERAKSGLKKADEGMFKQKAEANADKKNVEAKDVVQRKLIRDAHVEYIVEKFEAASQQVGRIVAEQKGFIATSSSTQLSNGKIRGEITLKVPPENLEETLQKLKAIGELKNQSLGSKDVSKTYFDTDARLRNARRMEERLLKMLDEASGKVTDLLTVEKELARVREQIEQMQGELKMYDALVQFATITLILSERDMDQAVDYVVREQAYLALFARDVDKTFRDAKHEAEVLSAQIVHSDLNRDSAGNITAVLKVWVAAEQSDVLLTAFKKLGRVHSLTWRNDQIPQGTDLGSGSARIKKKRVEIQLNLIRDDAPPIQQTRLTIQLKGLEPRLEELKQKIVSGGGEIRSSNFDRQASGYEVSQMTVRVSMNQNGALVESLKLFGKTEDFTVHRQDLGRIEIKPEDAVAEVVLTVYSPGNLVTDDNGFWATLRKTVTQAMSGLMWSLRMIGVAVAFLAPWVIIMGVVIWIVMRFRKR